ncbi:MAG: hypothetical protein JWO38_7992 [Gemmataceae bacterium]|nr:hypothetical protein [Gemmataceae bacterium]
MTGTGRSLGVLFGSLVAACASAQPPQPPAGYLPPAPQAGPQGVSTPPSSPNLMPAMPAPMTGAGPARVTLLEVVDPGYREAVAAVVRKPTIATRGTSAEFVCTPAVYEWLLGHPDRVALAWRRMGVPCVEISDVGNGKFAWADGEGSELVWQKVGQFPDGLVWYATGKVKASPITPTIPVRAVVVMSHPKKLIKDGTATINPAAQVYLQTDSKAAALAMRLLGPTAPKLAEQGADQLVLFFTGVARHAQTHQDKAEALLGPAKK